MKVRIDVYSHNLAVHVFSVRSKEAMLSLCRKMGMMGKEKVGNRWVWKIIKVFVGSYANRNVFRFHITQMNEVMTYLASYGILKPDIVINLIPIPKAPDIDIELLPHWKPRPDQEPVLDYLTEKRKAVPTFDNSGVIRVLTLRTGFGKTACSLFGAARLKKRILLTMKGGYTKKWRDDIKGMFGYGPKEIVVLGSTEDIISAIMLAKEGLLDHKIIVVSNKLLQIWLKHYESTNGDTSFYGCSPTDFCGVLGVGTIVRDEVHQEYHMTYRFDLYSHVETIINNSATLKSDNAFLNEMYAISYPVTLRYKDAAAKKYINVVGLRYSLDNPRAVRYENFAFRAYSHLIFEQSLLERPKYLESYFRLIGNAYEHYYAAVRRPKTSCLIYFSTVEMCTLFVSYIRERYPDHDIHRYCPTQNDDYNNDLIAGETVVTTLKAAGTAIDKPNLIRVFMTDSINSMQQNDQACGRLRELKDPFKDITPTFIYFYCADIAKQVDYHNAKYEILASKAINHTAVPTDHVLGVS